MKRRFQTPAPPITAADVRLPDVEAEAAELWAERDRRIAALTLRVAAAHTHSTSDRIAYAIDEWLITHPDVPVSTDQDYPAWTPGGAS